MPPSGYWFCENCDDTVTLPIPSPDAIAAAIERPEKCPRCHKPTANFKPAEASSQQASADHRKADAEEPAAPKVVRPDPAWLKQQFEKMRRICGY